MGIDSPKGPHEKPSAQELAEILRRGIEEAKEIWADATFPERIASATLTDSLIQTVPAEDLARRIVKASDDFQAEHHQEFIATARALLHLSGIAEE